MINKMSEIIAFAENQFSTNHKRVDFKFLQPKVYCHENKYLHHHHLYYMNNQLAGLYALYPCVYKNIKMLGIGTLCVEQQFRNLGLMTEMFSDIFTQNKDVDLMYLAGDKTRYEYFGFYHTGNKLIFKTKARALKEFISDNIKIREYQRNDSTLNKELWDTYQKGEVVVSRDANDYYDILRTKGYLVLLLENINDIGYAVIDLLASRVVELATADSMPALKRIMEYLSIESIEIEVSINDSRKKQLYRYSEKYQNDYIMSFKIVNYEKIIKNLLMIKTNITRGSLIIGGFSEDNYKIEVYEDVKVSKTQVEPDIFLSEFDAHCLLFSDYLKIYECNSKFELISSWFPLALPPTLATIDSI